MSQLILHMLNVLSNEHAYVHGNDINNDIFILVTAILDKFNIGLGAIAI